MCSSGMVAQLAEHLIPNQAVGGSTPPCPASCPALVATASKCARPGHAGPYTPRPARSAQRGLSAAVHPQTGRLAAGRSFNRKEVNAYALPATAAASSATQFLDRRRDHRPNIGNTLNVQTRRIGETDVEATPHGASKLTQTGSARGIMPRRRAFCPLPTAWDSQRLRSLSRNQRPLHGEDLQRSDEALSVKGRFPQESRCPSGLTPRRRALLTTGACVRNLRGAGESPAAHAPALPTPTRAPGRGRKE